jgi:hypothetical protein
MSSQLGPLDVQCDAPTYAVVRACRNVGIRDPEDVRWCHTGHFFNEVAERGMLGPFHFLAWQSLLGRSEKTCSCHTRLPLLERFTFTFSSGREETYMLGQCACCGTVFWEEA